MRAGSLRHRCIPQALQRNPDGMGGYSEGWTALAPFWAEITIPTGRVATVAQQLTAVVSAEIRARLRADLKPGVRIVHGGATYLIEAALPDNERSMLRLLCSNVTPTPR